jgi:hypothetical protein
MMMPGRLALAGGLAAAAAAAAAPPDLGVTYRSMGAGGLAGCDDGGLGASGASDAAECQRLCSMDPRCQFVSFVGTQCQWGAGCSFAAGSGQAFARASSRVTGSGGWYWASASLQPPGPQVAEGDYVIKCRFQYKRTQRYIRSYMLLSTLI